MGTFFCIRAHSSSAIVIHVAAIIFAWLKQK
jgi:hypothetical protein